MRNYESNKMIKMGVAIFKQLVIESLLESAEVYRLEGEGAIENALLAEVESIEGYQHVVSNIINEVFEENE